MFSIVSGFFVYEENWFLLWPMFSSCNLCDEIQTLIQEISTNFGKIKSKIQAKFLHYINIVVCVFNIHLSSHLMQC